MRAGVGVFVGCVGVVLAMNGELMEGRNMSDVCAFNQPRCFMMSYHVLLPFCFLCILETVVFSNGKCYVELSSSVIVYFVEIEGPERRIII